MYNRAFRDHVTRRGSDFLNLAHGLVDGPLPKFREFEPGFRYIRTNELKPEGTFYFPFYMVKQVQIEIPECIVQHLFNPLSPANTQERPCRFF